MGKKNGTRWICVGALSVLCFTPLGLALEKEAEADGLKSQTEALIAKLDHNEFKEREAAETKLKDGDVKAIPYLQAAFEKATEAESKMRLTRIIKALEPRAASTAEDWAALAKGRALAGEFGEASEYYGRAQTAFQTQAKQEEQKETRAKLEAQAKKAGERQDRAKGLANGSSPTDTPPAAGGGTKSVRIRFGFGGAAGGEPRPVVIEEESSGNQSGKSPSGKGDKEDW